MNYQSPLRDFQFVLHDLLQVPSMMQSCGQPEFDAATIDQVLTAAGQFASEVFGEEVKAVIQPAQPEHSGPALAEALKARCRELLGPIKAPRSIDFEVDFPQHAVGKLYKKLLRDRYLQQGTSS